MSFSSRSSSQKCDKVFRVVCLYSPNRNPARDLFFEDLHLKIDPLIPTLFAGNFNCVFNRTLDRRGSSPSDYSRESSTALSHLFDACCVTDIWRYLHPSSPGFTWVRSDGSLSSRIDLFGVPYAWVPSVSSCSVFVCPFSDHRSVSVTISLPDAVPPGPGFWKLNVSILEDPEYLSLTEDAWASWRQSIPRFPSLEKWWDRGKRLIKGLTIRYCSDKSKVTSANRNVLVCLIDHLSVKLDQGMTSSLEPYRAAPTEPATMDTHLAQGAQVRSRARWVEEGETSST